MNKNLVVAVALLSTSLWGMSGTPTDETTQNSKKTSAQSLNQVVQSNKILLTIVRILPVRRKLNMTTRAVNQADPIVAVQQLVREVLFFDSHNEL